mmetsp:Transcript_22888/g.35203  ORF Transcript_22888/g.35203 Transcript_22888/m.35203 type:complete len:266 (-) Transcript_22888:259-1056(-)
MVVQVGYIISSFRKAREVNLQRKVVLESAIWEEELMRLCKVLTDSSSSAKQKQLWHDISKTTLEKKKFIVNLYYYRQKLSSKIEFMEWYREEQLTKKKVDPQGQLILSISSMRSDSSMTSEDSEEKGNRLNKLERQKEITTRKFNSFGSRLDSLKKVKEIIDKFLEKGVNKYKLTEKKKKQKKEEFQITEKQMTMDDVDRSSIYITELQTNTLKKSTVLNSRVSEIDSNHMVESHERLMDMKELEVSEAYFKGIKDGLKSQKKIM